MGLLVGLAPSCICLMSLLQHGHSIITSQTASDILRGTDCSKEEVEAARPVTGRVWNGQRHFRCVQNRHITRQIQKRRKELHLLPRE